MFLIIEINFFLSLLESLIFSISSFVYVIMEFYLNKCAIIFYEYVNKLEILLFILMNIFI